MIFMGWFLCGFVGLLLCWRGFTMIDKPPARCPSPRAVAVCLAFSIVGGFALLFAIGVWLGFYIDRTMDRPKKDSWWTRPICDKRRS